MDFSFLGNEPPVPGTYKTSGYFASDSKRVGLFIRSGSYDFIAQADQIVYVNKVNSKIEVSFCSLTFNNPISPTKPFTVSARIVQN